ncbi:MAG: tetratricopeptide repeat protein [Croceibacterium sp.]
MCTRFKFAYCSRGYFAAVASIGILLASAPSVGQTPPDTSVAADQWAEIDSALDLKDYGTAARLLRPLSDAGHAKSQTALAFLHLHGLGVEQDTAASIILLKMASDQGLIGAQMVLGGLYRDGTYVPKDELQAATYFEMASQQGDAEAQFELGKLFDPGTFEGTPARVTVLSKTQKLGEAALQRDAAVSAHYYKLAAEQGSPSAQYNLANFYVKGIGVPQNHHEAARLFKLAALQGVASAQSNLAHLYSEGLGVERDLLKGYMWALMGAASGAAQAVVNRDVIAADLTTAQRAEAERRTTRCVESEYRDCD